MEGVSGWSKWKESVGVSGWQWAKSVDRMVGGVSGGEVNEWNREESVGVDSGNRGSVTDTNQRY